MESKDNVVKRLVASLHDRGFKTILLQSKEDLVSFIKENIPDDSIVGVGNSVFKNNLKILDTLKSKGNKIFYSWDGSKEYNRTIDTFEEHPKPDYYITTDTNITEQGEIINNDFSDEGAKTTNYPAHIIAVTALKNLRTNFEDSINKIKASIIDQKPTGSDVVVALMTFAA